MDNNKLVYKVVIWEFSCFILWKDKEALSDFWVLALGDLEMISLCDLRMSQTTTFYMPNKISIENNYKYKNTNFIIEFPWCLSYFKYILKVEESIYTKIANICTNISSNIAQNIVLEITQNMLRIVVYCNTIHTLQVNK